MRHVHTTGPSAVLSGVEVEEEVKDSVGSTSADDEDGERERR